MGGGSQKIEENKFLLRLRKGKVSCRKYSGGRGREREKKRRRENRIVFFAGGFDRAVPASAPADAGIVSAGHLRRRRLLRPATQRRRPAAPPESDATVAVSLLPPFARSSCRTPSASVYAPVRSPICCTGTLVSPSTRLQPAAQQIPSRHASVALPSATSPTRAPADLEPASPCPVRELPEPA